jgi:hypothetical protein
MGIVQGLMYIRAMLYLVGERVEWGKTDARYANE